LGTFWQGPYLITDVLVTDEESIGTIYTIENLITGRHTKAHISLLKPFYWDKNTTTPLNVAARDSQEFVVEDIIDHRTNPVDGTILWRVRWDGYSETDDTWEPFNNLRNVEKFHTYCQRQKLFQYLPRGYIKKPRTRRPSGLDA
jgi:hypothetical protein